VVNFHLIDLKSLLGFVSDSVPAVSSDDCATSLQVQLSGRDDIYIDPAAIGVEPACKENPENHRKLLRFDALCEDLKKNLDSYCGMMECEQLRNYVRFNKPFANINSRFFVLSESNYTHGRSLSVFYIEDTPPGNCEGFLKTIQGGELPRPTNLTKSRTLLSGDLMVVKVMKEDTSDRECLYVAEDRRRNDRYTVSHRVRIEDSEKGEVFGTELKFREMWAAKLGLWEDTIVAEITEDANARKTFLELRVRRVSYQKAHMIATTVTRSDIIVYMFSSFVPRYPERVFRSGVKSSTVVCSKFQPRWHSLVSSGRWRNPVGCVRRMEEGRKLRSDASGDPRSSRGVDCRGRHRTYLIKTETKENGRI